MKPALRKLGLFFQLDGLFTFLFGRRYVGLFRWGAPSNPFRQAIDWLLDWPGWLLRSAGLGEALLGLAVLRRAPVSVPDFYGKVSGAYAAIDPGWRKWFYTRAHAAFDLVLAQALSESDRPHGARVLDLGSGLGANLSRILDLELPYHSYLGVDLSPAMLEKARRRFRRAPNACFQHLDLMADPLPAGPYDLILSTWVFEHLPDPLSVVDTAWEQLHPGGKMVLLFEVQGRTWQEKLTRFIYTAFSARFLTMAEVERFPGLRSIQTFHGPLGELALAVLQRE